MSDNYVELLEEAQDALCNLLRRSEPGTGLDLHRAYNILKETIAKETGKRDDEPDMTEDQWAINSARRLAWKRLPMHERERIILENLGDDRLGIRDLTDRVAEAVRPDYDIFEGMIRGLVTRMWKAGELDRVGEAFQNKVRYRYFRKALAGPIADLERAFTDPGVS